MGTADRGLVIVELVMLCALSVFIGSSLPLRLSRRLRPLGYQTTWSLLALATAALLAENFGEM